MVDLPACTILLSNPSILPKCIGCRNSRPCIFKHTVCLGSNLLAAPIKADSTNHSEHLPANRVPW